jgi:hypothetical protein
MSGYHGTCTQNFKQHFTFERIRCIFISLLNNILERQILHGSFSVRLEGAIRICSVTDLSILLQCMLGFSS